MGNVLEGKVIKILDGYKLVINKGSRDGVIKSNRFLIYHLDEEMIDPDTGNSLGWLEIVCGEGKPEHIQERITTLVTCRQDVRKSKTVVKHSGLGIFGATEETYDPEITLIPFEKADENCLFKQIE